jgi:hypothetical protein
MAHRLAREAQADIDIAYYLFVRAAALKPQTD